ncbi:hypothetical protein OAN58_02660, partial [Paracoccaceae bacterium]|nr:hypothetical protein [Paracoccaceae bacterium]
MNFDLYKSWRYIASYSALNYLQASAAMLLTLMLASFLTVETFAEYRVGITVFSIVSVAGLYGAEKGLLIDLVHRETECLTIFAYFVVRLFVAFGSVAVVTLFMVPSGALEIVVLFGCIGVLAALRSPGWFDYRMRLRQHAVILFADRTIFATLAASAILVLRSDLGAFELGVMALVATSLTLVVELVILSRFVKETVPSVGQVHKEAKGIFQRHSWVWFLALSNMLMTSLGQLVLFARGGSNEIAYLGIALQFAMVLRLFMQQVVRLRGPTIA